MVTVTLPDELAERVAPFGRWLPHVLEVGLLTLKTPAAETAGELIEFLKTNPSVKAVSAYHPSERAQARMERLLALNQAGILGADEARELGELIRLEHLIINLKARLTTELSSM